jgi:AmiR/NasT family two-component response regulator
MKELQVIIGESDPECAGDLARQVKKLGHRVVATVSSGNEATLKVKSLSPDLVVINSDLPGNREGISAAEEIHALTGVPVVMVVSPEKKYPILAMDIEEFCEILVKPFDEPGLARAIQSALHYSFLRQQLKEAKEELEQYRAHIDTMVAERTSELEQENARQKKLLHDIEQTERKLATGTLVPSP